MNEQLNFQTKAELVYSALRDRILTGEYPPGARVPISKVARELGVSAVPVREGIKRLEAEGLLRFETHKGATVTKISAHEIEELFVIRTELEALALVHAAQTITTDELQNLRRLLDEMADAERDEAFADYGRLNREFHLAIYDAQPYRRLSTMISSLWDSTDWCRRIFASNGDYVLASTAEHEGIYRALVDRDGDAAAALLRNQKRRALHWLLEHYERGDVGGIAEIAVAEPASP
jgi:DNA-binding GntR family transcriptional regulator